MTKQEKACKDMGDVCELAHQRTVRECAQKDITVDAPVSKRETGYTAKAQVIFDRHYDHITSVTGI